MPDVLLFEASFMHFRILFDAFLLRLTELCLQWKCGHVEEMRQVAELILKVWHDL